MLPITPRSRRNLIRPLLIILYALNIEMFPKESKFFIYQKYIKRKRFQSLKSKTSTRHYTKNDTVIICLNAVGVFSFNYPLDNNLKII